MKAVLPNLVSMIVTCWRFLYQQQNRDTVMHKHGAQGMQLRLQSCCLVHMLQHQA